MTQEDEDYKKFLEHRARVLQEQKEAERLAQEAYNKHWAEVELPKIKIEHEKMWEERDRKYAEMVEADRVLVLKRQLLGEFLKVLDDATETLKEIEKQRKHVPSETRRENVGEILYWARQG
jgi:predicted transcriptional regulator